MFSVADVLKFRADFFLIRLIETPATVPSEPAQANNAFFNQVERIDCLRAFFLIETDDDGHRDE